jgi:hypothetical protein
MKTSLKLSIWALFLIFTFSLHAQKKAYPNELKGYDFFGRDRLSKVSLAKSTKQDIEKIFGEDCSASCDFDENWRIRFEYLGDFALTVWDGNAKAYKEKIPKPQYIGKLFSILFLPKNRISLKKDDFPAAFVKGPGGSRSSSSRRWEYSYSTLWDEYGLRYNLLEMIEAGDDVNDSADPVLSRNQGDLIEIVYGIPAKKQKDIWIKN